MLIIAMPTAAPSTEKSEKNKQKSGIWDSKTDTINEKEEITRGENIQEDDKIENNEEYERYMENKLEQAISVMEGAGKVKVVVRVNTSRELVVEKDMPATRSNTTENDAEGGSRNINELENGDETVYIKASDGSETPYVVKTIQPVIEGVVVVAQGGNRPEVSKNITEAIVALFDIEPHKIKIVKMKSE